MAAPRSWAGAIGRGWKTIAVTALVAGAIAAAVSYAVPPTYRAEARLLLSQPAPAVDALGARLPAGALPRQEAVQTQVELLRSRALLAEVVRRLRLDASPDDLARRVTVTRLDDSSLVAVAVRAGEPRTAADLANTLATAYLADVRAARQRNMKTTADALASRVAGVQQELSAIDTAAAGRRLSSEQATQRQLASERLSRLTDTLEQLSIAQQVDTGAGSVTDAAIPPARPSEPTPLTSGLAGLIVGSFFGTLLVVTQEARAEADPGTATGPALTVAPADDLSQRRGA